MEKTEKSNSLFSLDKQGFTAYLESKNFTKKTQEAYIFRVQLFLAWFKNDAVSATKKDILNFLAYLKNQRNQSNQSRSSFLNGLRHYFEFLKKSELIASNTTAFIKIRGTVKKQLHTILNPQELELIHDQFYQSFIVSYDEKMIKKALISYTRLGRQRNYIMLGFLLFQGLMTSELAQITCSDLDIYKATIKIKGSNKGAERVLQLKAAQIGSVMDYLHNIRPKIAEMNPDNDLLFLPLPPANKKSSNTKTLIDSIKLLAKQTKTVSSLFYSFNQIRTSVITQWIKNEGIRKAQYYAGHRNTSTTEKYIANDLQTLTDNITKHHPF